MSPSLLADVSPEQFQKIKVTYHRLPVVGLKPIGTSYSLIFVGYKRIFDLCN